ncbi:MAG: hypothetical protein K9K21_12390 [Desulfotignum sp.]|nr:hypothetical protein [Desulfotignum sp.]
MAYHQRQYNHHQGVNSRRRNNHQEPMHPSFKHLDVRCMEHPRPKKMVFIGFGRTPKGYPVAIYACPVCNYREAYGQDTRTGEPRLIFYQHPD